MPSPEYRTFVDSLAAARLDPGQPVEEQRAGYDLLGTLLPLAENVAVTSVDAGGVPAEWVSPTGTDAQPPDSTGAILLLHGGGYCIGGPNSHRPFASHLAAAAGRPVLVIDYRRAPEHPYPAALEDATAAWQWLTAQRPGEPVAVVGDSAGGGLALALSVSVRASGDELPERVAVVSPWVDLTCDAASIDARADVDPVLHRALIESWSATYRAGQPATDPLISPLFADLAGLGPLLVAVGGNEVLYDDGIRLIEQATAAGVDVTAWVEDDLCHTWPVFVGAFPEALAGAGRLATWLTS
ncbi:MAG: alpha/beta hydrolase [Acidimicrobiia bacterium]|nr:alpha/beta hydrolase [Acidimicrobiia bacterium]